MGFLNQKCTKVGLQGSNGSSHPISGDALAKEFKSNEKPISSLSAFYFHYTLATRNNVSGTILLPARMSHSDRPPAPTPTPFHISHLSFVSSFFVFWHLQIFCKKRSAGFRRLPKRSMAQKQLRMPDRE